MRNLIPSVVVSCLLSAPMALAQTAPPTPEVPSTAPPAPPVVTTPPATPDATAGNVPMKKSDLASMYEEFRALKDRLPFGLGAGVYLFYFQPLTRYSTLAGGSPDGTTEGSLDGVFQVYAFYLKLDKEFHGFGGHAEIRMRDGGHATANSNNAYLRSFFTSNIWFQEIYAYYTPGPYLKVKGGKFYRKVGIFWDDSFWGNLQYFDGQKLNPDYGLSAEGEKTFCEGRWGINYSAQYFINSDGINGGLDYGRTVGPGPGGLGSNMTALRVYSPNPEGQQDTGNNRVGSLRHVFDGRLAGTAQPHRSFGLELGLSGLTGMVRRTSTTDTFSDEARMTHAAGDLTLNIGPVKVYGEYLRQWGPAVRDADYALAGARATFGRIALRFNTSYVDYHFADGPDVQEFMLVPGITATILGGLSIIVEYDEWRRRDPRVFADYYTYDRSMSFVLAYAY